MKRSSKNQLGMAHLVLFLLVIVILAVGFAGWKVMSANKDKSANNTQQNSQISGLQEGSGPNYKALASCGAGAVFNTLPITISDYYQIIPLGNLNVPDHAIPTDHLYVVFNHAGQTSKLRSPGKIVVFSIVNSGETVNGKQLTNDYALTFSACRGANFDFAHVQQLDGKLAEAVAGQNWDKPCDKHTPAAGEETFYCTKTTDIVLQPGDPVGTVGGASVGDFDFGAHDASVKPAGFADPGWYSGGFINSACALDYFTPSVKAQLYGLIKRTQKPVCGQVGQDKAGTAQGAWFATQNTQEAMNNWDTQLALVHNNINPGVGILSVAGTISSPMMYAFTPRHSGTINREPSEITSGDAIYCYQTEPQPQNPYISSNGTGKVLVKFVNNKLMQLEHQDGACTASESFTAPTIYYR